MNDLKIYKKAARNVKASLVLFYVLLAALIIGTIFLLRISLFSSAALDYTMRLYMLSLVQLAGFLALFWYLAGGSKASRIVFWLGILMNFGALYLPFSCYTSDPSGIYTWLAWAACLVIEDVILYNVGTYIFQNHSCKIYYDHVIEIDEDDPALFQEYQQDLYEQPAQISQVDSITTPPLPSTPTANPSQRVQPAGTGYKPPLSRKARLQRLSVKLGICVYGEMILFPVLVSMFSDYFASTDLKSVFATRDIFILCIASSFIWTIAIFFLYYASSQSRKVVLGCWAGEILVNLWYIPRFIGYYKSLNPAYPLQVFLFFIVLDLVRYALIILVTSPVFQKNPS